MVARDLRPALVRLYSKDRILSLARGAQWASTPRLTAPNRYDICNGTALYSSTIKSTDFLHVSPISLVEFNRSMFEVRSPDLHTILESAEVIAVIGCSANPARTSHKIAQYMDRAGYRIVPVNPKYDSVLGEPCYPDLPSVPPETEIDIADIFRAPKHTADMVRTVIQRVEQTNRIPVVWTQIGVSSPEAEQLAAEANLPYVRNRCIKVEYDRLLA